uniref:hypothetical protein n=1 Tax=Fomitopsis dickinsii TaxID=3151107 RepID=UPI002A81E7F8|nr:hypothetical protein UYH45_mgp02 [Daedalea dickinsii]WNZ34368.1 hypothetical protein [Daedalea dickinsii]
MYDGHKSYSWFTDSPEPLFNQLLKRKYKGYHVYLHNLSRFDITFIFKYLSKLSNQIKFLIRDDKIISISINNKSKNISIIIKDSLLILPDSLSKLSKQFCIDNPKLIEPVLVSLQDSDIDPATRI